MSVAKKLMAILATLILACTSVSSVAYGVDDSNLGEVQYSPTPSNRVGKNLKKAGLKFDLKKNKTVTSTMYARGGGFNYAVRVTGFKKTSPMPGFRRVTFVVNSKVKSFNKKEKSGLFNKLSEGYSKNSVFGDIYCVLVDYKTGQTLNEGNSLNVSRKVLSYKEMPTKTYWNSGKYVGFKLQKTCKAKISVTFPKKYTGLCIGVGGSTYPRNKANNVQKKYVKGKSVDFYKTTMYKRDKNYFHFMRIKK